MSDQVSVVEFDELIKKIFEKREEIDRAEEVTSYLNKELAQMKARATEWLETAGREKYVSEYGTVARAKKINQPMPQSDEDKEVFRQWVRDGFGEDMLRSLETFNAMRLKSFVTKELDLREESGNLDASIPGLPPRTEFYDLSMRRPTKR